MKSSKYSKRELTTLSLVDGAKIMVEIYEPKTIEQKLWKAVWLQEARKLINEYVEQSATKNCKKNRKVKKWCGFKTTEVIPNCPKCGNNRQVWKNQLTGKMTCHRAYCQTEIK
jgi:hypothetical protein